MASIRIGFKGGQLAALDMLDNFGQRSVLRFSNVQSNAAIGNEVFRFTPPAGADLLRN
jgi:outer membrane lipoprotein carrier protein